MKRKKFVILVLIIVGVMLVMPALFVFIVDPLEVFHKQLNFGKKLYLSNGRYRNIPLLREIKNIKDKNITLIMGTSMTQNFVPSIIEKIFNDSKVYNLAMPGSIATSQSVIINKALNTHNVKRVIHGLFFYERNKLISHKGFPAKLYKTDNFFEKLYFYTFNFDMLRYTKYFLTTHKHFKTDLDKANAWWYSDVNLKLFKEHSSSKNIKLLNQDIKNSSFDIKKITSLYKKYANNRYKYIDNLAKRIQENPNIEFNYFFPPFSTYFYRTSNILCQKIEKEFGCGYKNIYVRKYVVDKLSKFKNVNIFGFDDNKTLVNNIYYYKDFGHYRIEVNNYIAKSIKNKTHLLTKDNIDEYLQNMLDNINLYDEVFYEKK